MTLGKTAKSILISCASVWPHLTSPSSGRSCPMTSWSLTASGIGKRRYSSRFLTPRPPITSLLPWPFHRCSICCVNGPTMFTGAPAPPCTGAVGRGGQHGTGAPARKNLRRDPLPRGVADALLPAVGAVQGHLR